MTINRIGATSLQANDQKKRFDGLTMQCKSMSPEQDLMSFVRMLQPDTQPKVPKKSYAPPINDADEVCMAGPTRRAAILRANAMAPLLLYTIGNSGSDHSKCNRSNKTEIVCLHRVEINSYKCIHYSSLLITWQ